MWVFIEIIVCGKYFSGMVVRRIRGNYVFCFSILVNGIGDIVIGFKFILIVVNVIVILYSISLMMIIFSVIIILIKRVFILR